MDVTTLSGKLGIDLAAHAGRDLACRSPIDGAEIAVLRADRAADVQAKVGAAAEAWLAWRDVPPPRRGERVRPYAEALRAHKNELGTLVSIEAGKILQEGRGEVQEMIDICDLAVGLSRQLYGLTIASERPGHRMMETWHPLGVVGVITAFNFPVAVWAWNSALALVCGDALVWKPSDKTPLCALACNALLARAIAKFGDAPAGLCQVAIGGGELGEALADDRRLRLISATGSTRGAGPAAAYSVASASSPSAGRTPITCGRHWSRCRRRPSWCGAKPSPRSCT